MKKKLQSQLDNERRAHAEKVNSLLAEFKQDMHTVESAHRRKTSEQSASTTKLEAKVAKQ